MAEPSINTFTTFHLSEQEQQVAAILSPQNIQMLHNIRADTATKQLARELPATPEELKRYEFDIIHAQARIAFINELLAHHESALQYLQDARQQHQQATQSEYDGSIYSAFANHNQSE